MGTDDPGSGVVRGSPSERRFRRSLTSKIAFFVSIFALCSVLLFLFSPSQSGYLVSKNDDDDGPTQEANRKFAHRRAARKESEDDGGGSDNVLLGHSLAKGEDDAPPEAKDAWIEMFGGRNPKKVSWRRFALHVAFEFSEDLRLLPKLAVPVGLNASALKEERDGSKASASSSSKKGAGGFFANKAKRKKNARITKKDYRSFIDRYGNEGLKLAAARAFQFLKLCGARDDDEALVNKDEFLSLVLENKDRNEGGRGACYDRAWCC